MVSLFGRGFESHQLHYDYKKWFSKNFENHFLFSNKHLFCKDNIIKNGSHKDYILL